MYALRRLARGLGSANGAARQGFALALAAALAAVPEIQTLPSLDLLDAALEVSKSMKVRSAPLQGALFFAPVWIAVVATLHFRAFTPEVEVDASASCQDVAVS